MSEALVLPTIIFNFPSSLLMVEVDYWLVFIACDVVECDAAALLRSKWHSIAGYFAFGLIGFLQWFVLVPWLFNRVLAGARSEMGR